MVINFPNWKIDQLKLEDMWRQLICKLIFGVEIFLSMVHDNFAMLLRWINYQNLEIDW